MREMGKTRTPVKGTKRDTTKRKERIPWRIPAFFEDNTFQETPDEDNEPDIELGDEESWGDGETPQDVVDSESPDFQVISLIHPLWLLYKGRLIWAGARLGRDIPEREFFRRRVQMFLDFLAGEFPDKSDEDRLLAMQKLFMEEKKGKDTAWLSRLDRDGIVYSDGKIISLKALITGQGGGGQGNDSCPKALLLMWLERELKNHPGESPLDWKNCKSWIMGINDFLSKVNDALNHFIDSGGIGLKKRSFHYLESTIQRRRLGEWKKMLNERQKTRTE